MLCSFEFMAVGILKIKTQMQISFITVMCVGIMGIFKQNVRTLLQKKLFLPLLSSENIIPNS